MTHPVLWRGLAVAAAVSVSVLPLCAQDAEDESGSLTKDGLMRFEAGDSIETLRTKIERNGFEFEVGHNWVYDMPAEDKELFLSRHQNSADVVESDDMGPLAQKLGTTTIPDSFDWRSYNGHAYIGAVRNQGDCGSCYSFGACAAAEGTYNVANGLYGSSCANFSEAYIVWCLGSLSAYSGNFGGCDGADYTYSELKALVNVGVCTETAFPYDDADSQSCPSSTGSAAKTKFASWHRITCGDTDAIKTAIMTYGVVDAAVYVGSAFEAYSSGIYNDSNTSCSASPCYNTETNHAIALVGWNDNGDASTKGYWILRNSWDTDWGESGYMRIRYTAARVSCEAAYLVYGTASMPTPTKTPTKTRTPTKTPTKTPTPKKTPTKTPTPKKTPTKTPTPKKTPTKTPTPKKSGNF